MFHMECIHSWLNKNNTCPLCRWELPSKNYYYEMKKRIESYNDGIYHIFTQTF